MPQDKRAQRRHEIATEVKELQAQLGHEGPTPAFLNWVTDKIIDLEEDIEYLRECIGIFEARAKAEDDEAEREREY